MTLKPPEETQADALHALAKAGISSVPIIGSFAAEVFQWVIQPPLERRQGEWMQAVGEKLQELEEKQGINLEELGQNEQFVSAVLRASRIAMYTHEIEKRDALRNAVMNVAVGQSPEEALQHMFFEWIDTFSAMHLQELSIAGTPPQQRTASQRITRSPFDPESQSAHGQLKREIEDMIWADLHDRRLVNVDKKPAIPQINMTKLGKMFLDFICTHD